MLVVGAGTAHSHKRPQSAGLERPYDQLYGEIFEQIAWAEQQRFDDVWLSEHHFIEDGYSPSLMPIAAAIAARTKTIRIGTSVVLLPFHNPIRLAEDGATVDVISGGRFELGVGTGYKVEEFSGFAISSAERGGRTNEGLELIRRLWEGETVTFNMNSTWRSYRRSANRPRISSWPTVFSG